MDSGVSWKSVTYSSAGTFVIETFLLAQFLKTHTMYAHAPTSGLWWAFRNVTPGLGLWD